MPKKKAPKLPHHPDFPDKYAKHVPEHWVSTAEAMEKEDLERCIVECEMLIEKTENDVADDTKIQQMKEDLKFLREGYTELLSAQKAKIKFCLYLMNSRGYSVLPADEPAVGLDDSDVE